MSELSRAVRAALIAARQDKVAWYTIAPTEAVDITFPHPTIWGPLSENGGECPWPWEPEQLIGVPMGQYHCGYCLAMCVAGTPHPDYVPGWDDGPPPPIPA